MRRHLLLYRWKLQYLITPRLLRRQPLVEYVSRQRVLPGALGLSIGWFMDTSALDARSDRSWWVLPAEQLRGTDNMPEEMLQPPPQLSEPVVEDMPVHMSGEEDTEAENALRQIPLATSTRTIPPGQPAITPVVAAEPAATPSLSLPARQTEAEQQKQQRARIIRARSRIVEIQPGDPGIPPDLPASNVGAILAIPLEPGAPSPPGEEAGPGAGAYLSPGQDALVVALEPSAPSPSGEEVGPDVGATLAVALESQAPETGTGAEELFASTNSDRSPQAWLARLNRHAQEELRSPAQYLSTPGVQALTPVKRVAEPVSQRARTFLKPLLGVDPAQVRIYRDALAEQETTVARADALSKDGGIELAPGHMEETPEALGLLAHELTHVARQQHPRFIPPVVRPPVPGVVPSLSIVPALETLGEEELALRVERHVRRVARDERAALATNVLSHISPPTLPGAPAAETDDIVAGARPDRAIWGNLPAPWEPLPGWLVSGHTQVSSSVPPASLPPSTPVLPVPVVLPSSVSIGQGNGSEEPAEPGVWRAGTERSVSEPGNETVSAQHVSQPEPDLDTLAQQVYGLLKRRLSVEQRREQ